MKKKEFPSKKKEFTHSFSKKKKEKKKKKISSLPVLCPCYIPMKRFTQKHPWCYSSQTLKQTTFDAIVVWK